ncbi:MAG TPA: hypothetical protein PLP57_07465 [Candidatus Saccharicenans sp.]|jgi:hypothetical protein|nr:hypothetical protein [Candidatus Saccharicenans sp.]HRD02464.1 hypothetical protein [Candidatus Saccharicenans sp.]
MKKNYLKLSVIVGFLILTTRYTFSQEPVQVGVAFEKKVPFGMIFKKFDISSSGHRALFYIEHSDEINKFWPDWSKLEIYDPDNRLILEKVLERDCSFHGFSPDGKIILSYGDDPMVIGALQFLTLGGAELFKIDGVGDRRIIFDPTGKELALAALGCNGLYEDTVVYDTKTGKEKFRQGPIKLSGLNAKNPKATGFIGLGLFLPVGEDNLYLYGVGASLFLKKYDESGQKWSIKDIGGNISHGKFLDEEYAAVSYYVPDPEYKEGLVVVDWKNGQIVFRLENKRINDKKQKRLPSLVADSVHFDKEKNLVFLNEDGEIFILPFEKESRSWQEKKIRNYLAGMVSKSSMGKMKRFKMVSGEIYFSDEEPDRIIIRKIKSLKKVLE